MYQSEWKGSTDEPGGVATFKIEGVDYALRLDCFTSYQVVCEMLESAFYQGKSFAAQAMRSHITRAMRAVSARMRG
ncbi:MAG TPA: hypothetical protein VNL74_01665 [Methylococcus sp.]|nr:hypothetical protein [Methylococcus sp.]